ncbi:MAG: SAM-dependent methyltransferase [Candidatus Bilamarchaeaceae archaeon]
MVTFEEYQKEKNATYYKNKGVDFLKDFKTFAADKYFAEAIARDFYNSTVKRGTINVYELGVGTGTLFISIMQNLRRIEPAFAERVVYHLCDISEKLVKNAVRRGDAFGFNVDGIVYEGLPKFIKSADFILSNELYSDLPAKILLRNKNETFELHIENGKSQLKPFKGDKELIEYMENAPEDYLIPINVFARKHLEVCVRGLSPKGFIDVFDYGFVSLQNIREMYPEQWNNAIYRDYGGQVTTDLNFHFLSQGLKATVEPQKDFVQRVLKKHLEEDIDSMRYRECKTKSIIEESDFYHMRVRR